MVIICIYGLFLNCLAGPVKMLGFVLNFVFYLSLKWDKLVNEINRETLNLSLKCDKLFNEIDKETLYLSLKWDKLVIEINRGTF